MGALQQSPLYQAPEWQLMSVFVAQLKLTAE
jgi:hypothetical protein